MKQKFRVTATVSAKIDVGEIEANDIQEAWEKADEIDIDTSYVDNWTVDNIYVDPVLDVQSTGDQL